MKFLSGLRYNTLILFILFVVCAVFCCLFPVQASPFDKSNYSVLLGGLLICSGLLATKLRDKNLFLFDPFLFSSVLFFCIFLIQPMIDILGNEVYAYALVNPAYGCQKGTFIFVLFYIAFYIGSFFIKRPNIHKPLYQPFPECNKASIAFLSFILWCCFALLCMVFLVANGYTIKYIFTLGQLGQAHVDEIFSRMGFLWKFSASMIAGFMYYWVCGRNKLLKFVIFFITLSILLINGGRAVLLIFLFAPIVYHYAKRAKNPSIQYVVIVLSLFLVFAAVVQAARWSLRSGGEVKVETQWNMDTILHPARSNFGVYKMYYLLVNAMPEKIDYLWGRETILYTAVMFVPRTLWKYKPDAPFRDILHYVAGDLAVLNGEAFPGLAEFYMDFGWWGCVCFGFIFGWLVSKLKNLYLYALGDTHSLVLYSILYPLLFQVIIRGYIPSLFYTLLCAFLPYFILRLFVPLVRRRLN